MSNNQIYTPLAALDSVVESSIAPPSSSGTKLGLGSIALTAVIISKHKRVLHQTWCVGQNMVDKLTIYASIVQGKQNQLLSRI